MKRKIQQHYFLSFLFLLLPAHTYAAKSNTVIATINTGITPTGIAITPDNHFAYVANNNNYGLTGEDSVSVLKLKNNTVKQTIFHHSYLHMLYCK